MPFYAPEHPPIGDVYGDLTVIDWGEPYVRPNGRRANRWRVQCVCGAVKDLLPTHLRSGRTTSCGCQTQRRGAAAKHQGCAWPSGCDRPHAARGLCGIHYYRFNWRARHGVRADLLLVDDLREASK